MVKMPSLDDLKKVGSGLVDSAKSVKLNEMVDKMKSGIDSVSANFKKESVVPAGDDAIKDQFLALYASLAELNQMQATQTAQIKKIESQVALLARAVASTQQPTTTNDEDKKNDAT